MKNNSDQFLQLLCMMTIEEPALGEGIPGQGKRLERDEL